MNKHILILAYSSLNLGDDLFIKILCERYPKSNFYLVSDKKYVKAFSDIKNITIINQTPFIDGVLNKLKIPLHYNGLKQLRIAKKMDAIIQIGGSIFIQNDNWVARYKFLDKLANIDIPYFVIGSNFGPYKNENYYQSYNTLFDKLDDVCFRDTYSHNLFKGKDNLRVAPDVIFGLASQNELVLDSESEDNVVISVIDLENREDLKKYKDEYENSIVLVIKELIAKNREITLMSFCKREGDLNAINRIKDNFNDNEVQVYSYDGNMHEALQIINTSSAVLATRFHSLILALVFGKRVFPFVYSSKTFNLLNDINFRDEVADIKNLESIDTDMIVEQLLQGVVHNIDRQQKLAEDQFKATDEYLR